jgi:hypothetical protein
LPAADLDRGPSLDLKTFLKKGMVYERLRVPHDTLGGIGCRAVDRSSAQVPCELVICAPDEVGWRDAGTGGERATGNGVGEVR